MKQAYAKIGAVGSIDAGQIIGLEWNQNTDTWRHINLFGETVTPSASYFDNHPIWGRIGRCTLTPEGVPTFGTNARGDGLDLTGAAGRVMVCYPKYFVKSANPSTNVYRFWVSPYKLDGFVVYPGYVQRGGVERNQIYLMAYAGDFEYDGANAAYDAANEKLHSRTGAQPLTGGTSTNQAFWRIPLNNLANEPDVADVVAGTEGGFFIQDYLKTAGSWGGGGAGDTALIWLRKPNDDSCGIINTDTLTNTTQAGETIGVVTANPTIISTTLGSTRTLCENIGAGWGEENIWTRSAWKLLWYIENATSNSQVALGLGVVSKASGTGFAGELNGADSADTNIGTNGTGTGTGTNGYTPVVWRGLENPWGNVWNFIDGYNAIDAEYRIIRRDGLGTFADTLTAGNYEASIAAPLTNPAGGYVSGYASNIEYEPLLALLFIPNAIDGASNSHLCDYFYSKQKGQTNILLAGGLWNYGATAGVAALTSADVSSRAYRALGARAEFIG